VVCGSVLGPVAGDADAEPTSLALKSRRLTGSSASSAFLTLSAANAGVASGSDRENGSCRRVPGSSHTEGNCGGCFGVGGCAASFKSRAYAAVASSADPEDTERFKTVAGGLGWSPSGEVTIGAVEPCFEGATEKYGNLGLELVVTLTDALCKAASAFAAFVCRDRLRRSALLDETPEAGAADLDVSVRDREVPVKYHRVSMYASGTIPNKPSAVKSSRMAWASSLSAGTGYRNR